MDIVNSIVKKIKESQPCLQLRMCHFSAVFYWN